MIWRNLLNKWKEILSSVYEQQDNNFEKIDAKIVFQDTKKSLEDLKKTVLSQNNPDQKKNQEKYLSKYIDRLLWFSVLSTNDKNLLNKLKLNISKEISLQESDFEDVIEIVNNLEQKAETLNEFDKEKVTELQKTLNDHKSSLNLLKQWVNKTDLNIEDTKKKAFEKIKLDLEKKRWSSWLAKPVYDYLMDKHINKKPVSKFYDWLMWTVGLTVVSWFVGKEVKDLIANIDNLNIGDVSEQVQSGVDQIIWNIEQIAPDKIEKIKAKYKDNLVMYFENKFGKKIDKDKFDQVFESWFADNKKLFNISEKWEEAMWAYNWDWKFNVLSEGFGLIVAPWKSVLDLLMKMKRAGIISMKDIVIDWIFMPSWKAVLNIGLWSVWLFYNTMKTVFTSMSSEDLVDYVKEQNDKLDVESRMALWWLLYRRGWWFWNLAGRLWTLAGEGLSLLFNQRTWWDVNRISAYWNWWIVGDLTKEMNVFKQLEDSLRWSWAFSKQIWEAGTLYLDQILSTCENNNKLFAIVQNSKDLTSMEQTLKRNWFDDVLNKLKFVGWTNEITKYWKDWDLKALKWLVWNEISGNMESILKQFEDAQGTWSKILKNKLNSPVTHYQKQIAKSLKEYAQLQDKCLQNNEIFGQIKNLYRKHVKWVKLSWLVESSDNMKLVINNVDDAKAFFDNIRTIWKHSPEILKTLFKGFPFVMIWKDILEKMWDPDNKDSNIKLILDWFMYLTPIVGPIKLISDWLTLEEWWFSSLASAGIWTGLLTLDWFFAFKALSKWEFLKFMTMPIRDSVSFLKSVWRWTYISIKMVADWIRVIRTWKTAQLSAEALQFLKWSGLRLAAITLLAYLWYLWYQEFFGWLSDDEKKQLADIEKLWPDQLESQIEKDWWNLDDEQKASLVRFAAMTKMWLSNIDDVEAKKDWNKISLSFKRIVDYDELKNIEQELQESLSRLENTKDIKLDFNLHGGEAKYELIALKKNRFTDSDWNFDQNAMEKYLMTMWYKQEIVNELMAKIV